MASYFTNTYNRNNNRNYNNNYNNNYNRNSNSNLPPATAPYNFIPYVGKTLRAIPEEKQGELYSGYIVCSLEALTPLLVSGQQANDEGSEKHFFQADGRYMIPGSSLKGMLRNVIQIISHSHLSPVSDKKIFWRNVAGRKNAEYKELFTTTRSGWDNESADKTILGGYLVKKGAEYMLYPVKVRKSTERDPKAYKTGPMYDKRIRSMKRNAYLFAPFDPHGERIDVSPEVFDDFMEQMTKGQDGIWRDERKKLERGEPARVFFIEDQHRQVKGLGVCRYFRVPYKHTVADLVKECPVDDFTANLFGYTRNDAVRRGRIRIEAAQFEGSPKEMKVIKAVLGEPHSSCLSHYLEQPNASLGKNLLDNLINYNKAPVLRGYKYYWHRKPGDYNAELPSPNGNENVASKLYPLEKGVKACFEIHLDRVNAVELGAVLEALSLPAHKLGIGKSIGLGSVRLSVQAVRMEKVQDLYTSLARRFEAHPEMSKAERQGCRDKFTSYVRTALGEKVYKELRETMARMADFDHCPQAEKTKTMILTTKDNSVACFKNKPILKKVAEI